MITKEEALAELKARGVDPSSPAPDVSTPNRSGISKDDAIAELRARGVSIPPATAQSSGDIGSKIISTGLKAVEAPFQVAGEAIRGAGEGEPLKLATQQDPSGFRAPSIIQQINPALQTAEEPANPFTKSYQGLEGLTQLGANILKGPKQAIQKASDTITAKPDLAANLGGMAVALGTGEAGNAPFNAAIHAGEKVAGLVPKFAKFANVIKDVNPEVVAQADKFGVPITAAGQTGGGTQASIENFLSRMPFSKDVIAKKAGETLAALDKNVRQPFLADVKPSEELAPIIQDSIANGSKTAYANAQSLYQNAANAIPKGDTIPLSNVQEKAKELFSAQSKLKDLGADSSGVSQILKKVSGEEAIEEAISQMVPKGASPEQIQKARDVLKASGYAGEQAPSADYQTLQGLRAELNDRIAKADMAFKTQTPGMKFQSSPEAGVYKQLKSALDKDITAYGEQTGGSFKQALNQANSTYSEYKQAFKNNKFLNSIINEQDPNKVVDKVISNIDNPKAVATLKANLSMPVLQDISKKLIQEMTEAKPGQFSPARFVTQYEKIGEEGLTNFLGPEAMKQVKPLYVLSKAATQAERIGANPSGTAQGMAGIMGMMAPVMQVMRGHPMEGATILASEMGSLPLAAKAYTSGPITNLLTNQTNVIKNAANTAHAAGNVARVAPNINDLIKQLKNKYAQRSKM